MKIFLKEKYSSKKECSKIYFKKLVIVNYWQDENKLKENIRTMEIVIYSSKL